MGPFGIVGAAVISTCSCAPLHVPRTSFACNDVGARCHSFVAVFVVWRLRTKVRTAIDLAIDRSALVTSLAGGKATRSFFPDYSPYYEGEQTRLH